MDIIKLTPNPLSVDEVTQLAKNPSCGAISLFVGTTRDNFEGKQVSRLEYEAYDNMAEKEMKKICEKCREKWSVNTIAIYHRLGIVEVQEASVIIAVSSEHRRDSLDAVSYLIDSLKASVPIWKKELYLDNKSEWKSNKECAWAQNAPYVLLNGGKIKEEVVDDDFTVATVKIEPVKEEFLAMNKGERLDDLPEVKPIMDRAFVQIMAPKEEIERRIQAFQDRKKEELNVLNIQEFCMNSSHEKDDSCARTSAIILRSNGSNSHLKFTKVVNVWGPQMSGIDPASFSKEADSPMPAEDFGENSERKDAIKSMKHDVENVFTSDNVTTDTKISKGIDERLRNMEQHLKVSSEQPIHSSVYSRLKALEDRILFLEGLSPEYFKSKGQVHESPKKLPEKRATEDDISLEEIDAKIFNLRKKLKERQLGITL